MWNDGELLLLRLFRLVLFRLGFFGLFCHDTLFAQGSEQSRINPQLRQISLQCTSSMGKPQTSQGSPSSSTADRSARLARTSRFTGSSTGSRTTAILPQLCRDFHRLDRRVVWVKNRPGGVSGRSCRTFPSIDGPWYFHWNR